MNTDTPETDKTGGSDDEGVEQPKKRVRVPNSCLVCRQRKIKCNKGRPACDQCSRRGVPHLCHYDDPRWMNILSDRRGTQMHQHVRSVNGDNQSTDVAMNRGMDELLARVKHVEAAVSLADWLGERQGKLGGLIPPRNSDYNASERVQLVDKMPFLLPLVMRKSRIEYLGSMSPVYDMKSDPYFRVVWLHMWKYLDLSIQAPGYDPTSAKDDTVRQCIMQFVDLRGKKVAFDKVSEQLRNSQQSLEQLILDHLPPKRTIFSLLNRFFRFYHVLIPVIEEQKFIVEDVERIIGGWLYMNQPPPKLYISDDHDYSYMGMLFCVMAIASMTLGDEDFEITHDFKFIKRTCTALYATVAQRCLDHSLALRKSVGSKPIFIAYLLNFYRHYAPEDDTISSGFSSDIEMGYIISIARSNGYHVDPSELESRLTNKEKRFELWRKFWNLIISRDASDAAVQGLLPRFSDDESYDTGLPSYNADLPPDEIFILEDLRFLDARTKLYRRLCTTLYQRKCDPTIGQLLELVDELREFSNRELGSLRDILIKNLLPYAKVKKISYLIEITMIEAGLRQRAIGHFHKEGNNKMVHQMFAQLVPLLTKLLNTCLNVSYNGERYFGHAYVFYLRPVILHGVFRCMMSFGTLLFRCVQCIKAIPVDQQTRLRAFRDLQTTLLSNMERVSQVINYINRGYYSAQRMNLGLCFLIHMLQDPLFDFDKAKVEVAERPVFQGELKRDLRFSGEGFGLPETNFMSGLLNAEVDALKANSESDIGEVLQPLVGERLLNINTVENIFPTTGGPREGHFSTADVRSPLSDDERREAESHIHKNIAIKFMSQKVDTIFAGSDTIRTSDTMMTPRQLAGEDDFTPGPSTVGDDPAGPSTMEDADIPPHLSAKELGDLFGLVDEYNWVVGTEGGVSFDGLGLDQL